MKSEALSLKTIINELDFPSSMKCFTKKRFAVAYEQINTKNI